MVLATIGVFEFFKGWLLYGALGRAVIAFGDSGHYLYREGNVRAMASVEHSIVLGFVMVIALGFFLFLRESITNRIVRGLWLALLLAGLIAPQSRGPWIGAVILFLVFIATGPRAARRILVLIAGGIIATPLILVSPIGEKMYSYLPFVGTVEQENVTYRQLLIENCFKLIKQNPFIGVPNAMETTELQSMRQGSQGIIDIVNSYVSIALGSGLIGLLLFVSIFTTIGFGIYKCMEQVAGKNEELHLLGRVLLATLVAIMVMIGTVSSISFIPVIYWSVAGIGLAYIRMVTKNNVAALSGCRNIIPAN